jgi:hypothetical protein
VYVVVAFSMIAVIVLAGPSESQLYFPSLLLSVVYAFIVLRLRFIYATYATLLIAITYEISALWLAETPLPVLMKNNFYVLASCALGVLAGYNMEVYLRREFLQRRAVEQSVEQLNALQEVGQSVGSTLDLETVLTNIVRHAVDLSDASGGVIYEYDERAQTFARFLKPLRWLDCRESTSAGRCRRITFWAS